MTQVPRGITARELVRALHTDGFRLVRIRGSHRIYRHADGRRVVVGYHRIGDTFLVGTLKAMITDDGPMLIFTASGCFMRNLTDIPPSRGWAGHLSSVHMRSIAEISVA